MSESIIKIENMNKWFGDFQVLKDIDLEVEKNKKIVVCGPSGSGKSTLIRYISIGFIEFWRGVPLITVLFMSAVMFPMFLPADFFIDKLVRLSLIHI